MASWTSEYRPEAVKPRAALRLRVGARWLVGALWRTEICGVGRAAAVCGRKSGSLSWEKESEESEWRVKAELGHNRRLRSRVGDSHKLFFFHFPPLFTFPSFQKQQRLTDVDSRKQAVSQSANSCVILWLVLFFSRHVSHTCCVSSKRPKTLHASVFWVASKTAETSAGVAGGEMLRSCWLMMMMRRWKKG